MKKSALLLFVILMCVSKHVGYAACEPPEFAQVLKQLKPHHPRLFLNQEMLEHVRRYGLSPEQQKWLSALMKRLERYPAPPPTDKMWEQSILGADTSTSPAAKTRPYAEDGLWGAHAAHTALAYLLTSQRRYFDCALGYLRHAVATYVLIAEHKRIPRSKAFVRLWALAAYDWLFNDLTTEERQDIGRQLFTALYSFYHYWRSRGALGMGITYQDEILGWYLGLVFCGEHIEGIDESLVSQLLQEEYKQYLSVFRTRTEGPDGVFLWGAIGYATQLLQTEVNFLDAWRCAIGGNFARYFPKHAYITNYFLWNTIPVMPQALTYGWSDSYHIHNNHMDPHHLPYLNRVDDLYRDLAGEINMEGLVEVAQFLSTPNYERFLDMEICWLNPASPLYFALKAIPEERVQSILARLPRARHFPDPVGQTFMNSGWAENDTYALFIAGRQSVRRKHYDENHFTIYKKGFLAMDTGARGYSMAAPGNVGEDHEVNYYYDTIAHNCVLIYMEGEKFPGIWGQPSVVNTGGMNKNYGALVKGFETNEYFTYIASDATSCYHQEKAQEVVRQFVFVCPDYFVVFDRVTSKKPEQKKTWLFHTQHEPKVQGDTFHAEHWEGKVFVRTLLPAPAAMVKIGGPGKEFWAGGRNWPVREDWQKYTPDQHLFGCWRMEISPLRPQHRDVFLHLIQVGAKQSLKEMTPSSLVKDAHQVGVEFVDGQRTIRVLFNLKGDIGGRIKIMEGEKVSVDRLFTNQVQKQVGLDLRPQ